MYIRHSNVLNVLTTAMYSMYIRQSNVLNVGHVLCTLYITIYIVYGWWKRALNKPVLIWKYKCINHTLLVWTYFTHAYHFVQPIMAACRPHPDEKRRPIFNWAHWLVGSSAHMLSGMQHFYSKWSLNYWFPQKRKLTLCVWPHTTKSNQLFKKVVYKKPTHLSHSVQVKPVMWQYVMCKCWFGCSSDPNPGCEPGQGQCAVLLRVGAGCLGGVPAHGAPCPRNARLLHTQSWWVHCNP